MAELGTLSIDEFTASARGGGGVNSKNCAKLATALSNWQADHPSGPEVTTEAGSDQAPAPEEAVAETSLQDDSSESATDSCAPSFLSPKGSGTPAGILGGVLAEADKASLKRSAELLAESVSPEATAADATVDEATSEARRGEQSVNSPGEESEATAAATEAAPQASIDATAVANGANEEDVQECPSPRKRSSSAAASLFKGVDDEFGDDEDIDNSNRNNLNDVEDKEMNDYESNTTAMPSSPTDEATVDDDDSCTVAPLPGLGDGSSGTVVAKETATALQALRRVSVHGLTSPIAQPSSSNDLSTQDKEARAAAITAGAATLNFEDADGTSDNIASRKSVENGGEAEGEGADSFVATGQAGDDHDSTGAGDEGAVKKAALKRGSVCFQGTTVQGTRSPSMKQREAVWNRQLSGEPELLEDDDGEHVANDASNGSSNSGFESEEDYLEQYLVPKFAHLLAMLERDEDGFVSAFVADSGLGLLASALKHVVDSALVHAAAEHPFPATGSSAADDDNAPSVDSEVVPDSPAATGAASSPVPDTASFSITPVSPLRMSHSGQGCSMSPAALTLQGLILAATLLVLDSTPGLEWALNNVEALSGIFISIQVGWHFSLHTSLFFAIFLYSIGRHNFDIFHGFLIYSTIISPHIHFHVPSSFVFGDQTSGQRSDMGRAYAILTSLCYSGDDYEENGRRLFVEVRVHFLLSLFLHTYASILVALGFVKFSPSLILVLRSRHAFFKLCPSLTLNQSTRCSSASTNLTRRALASTLLAAFCGTKRHLGRYVELPNLIFS